MKNQAIIRLVSVYAHFYHFVLTRQWSFPVTVLIPRRSRSLATSSQIMPGKYNSAIKVFDSIHQWKHMTHNIILRWLFCDIVWIYFKWKTLIILFSKPIFLVYLFGHSLIISNMIADQIQIEPIWINRIMSCLIFPSGVKQYIFNFYTE